MSPSVDAILSWHHSYLLIVIFYSSRPLTLAALIELLSGQQNWLCLQWTDGAMWKLLVVVLKKKRFYFQGKPDSNWSAGEDEAQIGGCDGMLVMKFKHSTNIDGQDDTSQWLCVRVVPAGRLTGLLEEVTEPTSKYAEADDLIGGSCIIRHICDR